MALIRPGGGRQRVRQFPGQGIPQVNPNHPLAVGMTSCFVTLANGIVIDALRPRGISPSTTSFALGPHGFRSAFSTFSAGSTNDLNWTSGPFTAMCWMQSPPGQSGTYTGGFSRSAYVNESNNQGWGISWRPSTDHGFGYSCVIAANNGVFSYTFPSGDQTYTTNDLCFGFSSDGVAGVVTFANGFVNAFSNTTNLVQASCSTGVVIGDSLGTGVYIALTMNRHAQQNDITEFYQNPYGMLIYPEDSVPWVGGLSAPPPPPPTSGPLLMGAQVMW